MQLDDKIYDKIVELCEEGDNLTEDDRFHDAIDKYKAALDLVPSPKRDWEASTWIYTALGDTYFLIENYKNAKECFFDALNCPNGITNPLILLRLGESLFEIGEFNEAKAYLLKAYMLEGYKIFNDEDDKYFDLIKEMI